MKQTRAPTIRRAAGTTCALIALITIGLLLTWTHRVRAEGNPGDLDPTFGNGGQANVVQFSASNYNVQEDCTTVTITVDRIGDMSGPASVDYATSNITTTDRGDYITTLGTLQFAAGEASKSFAVLINEDSYVEGPETFSVNLSNPSGTSLGGPSIATISISDDVNELSTNAIDDARNFVCQHYHDFLNRQPEQAGWDFWTNEITSCGSDQQCIETKRVNVSAAFFLSIEFKETGYLVERMYKAAYGDAVGNSTFSTGQLTVPMVRFKEFLADTQKIRQGVIVLQPGWEQQLENNKQAYASEFVHRAEFYKNFPISMTPSQLVVKLDQNVGHMEYGEWAILLSFFGGATDISNKDACAKALRFVAEFHLQSPEFNRAFSLMQYFGYLRRNPNDPQDIDYSGYDFWLTKLNQFNGNYIDAEMVKAFITSSEYRQRFGL